MIKKRRHGFCPMPLVHCTCYDYDTCTFSNTCYDCSESSVTEY